MATEAARLKRKRTSDRKRKNRLDTYRPSHGRTWRIFQRSLQERQLVMSGPVSSGYPGVGFTSVFAAFFAFILGRTAWLAYKRRSDTAGRTYLFVAFVALYLLTTAIWSIWKNR